MDKPSPDLPHGPNEGRLDSWKKIAVYLKRDITTVQRWEKREGMPVHRHLHDKIGSVYAFQSELDGWMPLIGAYSVDPTWSPDGRFVVYSGPDIGTKFEVKAATAESAAHPLPELVLTRGARHVALLPGGRKLVFLQGEIQHKNLWVVDLETGAMQQLTHIPAEFDVRDFDLSADGTEAILERAQSRSDVVVIDRPPA